jgi:PHP family Zn ribbon phosphoesterase
MAFAPRVPQTSIISFRLRKFISEILSVRPKNKNVNAVIDRLVAAFGPELAILQEVPADDLAGTGGTALTEAISRLRRGEVIKDAGYDGEYGRVRLLRPGELDHAEALFGVPASPPVTRKPAPPATGKQLRLL